MYNVHRQYGRCTISFVCWLVGMHTALNPFFGAFFLLLLYNVHLIHPILYAILFFRIHKESIALIAEFSISTILSPLQKIILFRERREGEQFTERYAMIFTLFGMKEKKKK